uniref:Uncharacterized protein n=1 Tax=Sphaerodactylus townsendi TaxID=933632 RepID=A0ACB8FTI6_9SAUR
MERRQRFNYWPRYFNTERQAIDIQPGENVAKYIRDFFDTSIKDHLISCPSLSSSSSSPDLTRNRFLLPTEQRTPVDSDLINSVSSAFSAGCSPPRHGEASSSGDDVFLEDPLTTLPKRVRGSPALLAEEPNVPRDQVVAPPDRKDSVSRCISFHGSTSQVPPSPFPWDPVSSESENEDEFLIAESFGDPFTSWLSQPKKNSLPTERSLPSPPLESNQATQEPSIGNECDRDQSPVVDPGLFKAVTVCFSKQSQSVGPPALQSSTGKQVKKAKCPKNVPLKNQAERKSSVRDVGRKLGVLILEEDVESKAKELGDKCAGIPPGDRLIPSGKRRAPLSPEDECGRASPQEGSCEAEKALSSMEGQNSRTLSVWGSSVRAISVNDLSGPVCKAKETIPCSKKALISSNMEVSLSVRPPDDTASLRRSRRLRLKPLEYWRGERVMYNMDPSGELVASGIISPKEKRPCKLRRIKEPGKSDIEKVLENTNTTLKDVLEPALVFDAASKQEVLQECVSSGHSHLLFFSNEDMSIYKYFSTPLFSAGKLILKPFKEKGSQYSPADTLVFHIVKGRLLFTLYGQCYSLRAGNYFYVPAGNIYNIQNTLNEECIMVFTQIKGNR